MANRSVKSSVWIPAVKSLATGLFFGLVSLTALALSAEVTIWRIFWFVGAIVSLGAWLVQVYRPGPKITAPGRVYPQVVHAEIISKDPSGAYLHAKRGIVLPVSPEKLAMVADIYFATGDFTHAAMAGKGKPLSRSNYESLRTEMLRRGLAYKVNPEAENSTVALTLAGITVLRRYTAKGQIHAHTRTQADQEVA